MFSVSQSSVSSNSLSKSMPRYRKPRPTSLSQNSSFEKERAANIADNKQKLVELGIKPTKLPVFSTRVVTSVPRDVVQPKKNKHRRAKRGGSVAHTK